MITDLTSFANIEAPHVNGFEPTVHITDEGLESYNTIDVSGARWIKNLSIVTFDDAEDIGSPTNPYIVANYFAGQIQAISTKPDPTDPQYRLLIELVYDTFTVGTYDQPTDPQYAGQEVITHWIRHQYGDITEVEVMPFQLVEDTSYSGGLSNPNTRRIKIRGGVWEIPTQGAWNSGTPRMISGGAFTTGAGSDPYSFATVLSGCEIEDGQVQWWYLSIDTSSWYTLTAKMLDHYPTYESLDSNIKRLGYVQNIGGVLNFVQV